MENRYLYINNIDGKIEVNSSDGVFSSITTLKNKESFCIYCESKANDWLESKLGNYTRYNAEKRRIIANKWIEAKNLSEGKYNYYFNIDDKKDLFRKEVESLAKSMGIVGYMLVLETN